MARPRQALYQGSYAESWEAAVRRDLEGRWHQQTEEQKQKAMAEAEQLPRNGSQYCAGLPEKSRLWNGQDQRKLTQLWHCHHQRARQGFAP